MNESWLKNPEKELNDKFNKYLQDNPYQESLLEAQTKEDLFLLLESQKDTLLKSAEKLRQSLLELAIEIKEWQSRTYKANQGGAQDLANRAQKHLQVLMKQGRSQWEELDQIGNSLNDLSKQIVDLSQQKKPYNSMLEKDWAQFEAEHELSELKKKSD